MKKPSASSLLFICAAIMLTVLLLGCDSPETSSTEGEIIVGGGSGSSETSEDSSKDSENDDVSEDGGDNDKTTTTTTVPAKGLDELGSTNTTTTGSNELHLPAFIQFTSPADGQIIKGSAVKLELKVSGLKLVNKLGQPPVSGEGHIHYSVDGTEPYLSDKNVYEISLKPGNHSVIAELRNNDHTVLSPPVTAIVRFTVS